MNKATCFEDCMHGTGVSSPCLKLKGHSGKHEHVELCANPGCICGGFNENLKRLDLDKRYLKALAEYTVAQKAVWLIREHVQAFVDKKIGWK